MARRTMRGMTGVGRGLLRDGRVAGVTPGLKSGSVWDAM